MPAGEDQSPTRPGYSPYSLSRFDKPCGRALWVYAPASRILLPVRRVADLEGYGLVGLLEAHIPQQILHPERVGFIVSYEQLYLVQVVLGTVGSTSACYPGFGEPVCVLSEQRVHGA